MNDFIKIKNILDDVPSDFPEEIIQEILSPGNIRIERIVSRGQSSPDNFWYDQEENEWVMVIKGTAVLKFFNESKLCELKEGDYLNIPSHKKHRVEWTDPESETIWLAVFY